MIYALILACEVAFWLLLLAGLACRYLYRQQRLSTVFLICIPIVDLLLLALTAYDLARGAQPNHAHGLATLYLGFTIAFGPLLVSWADSRFSHHYLGTALPEPAPTKGWPAFRYELSLWLRCLVANVISTCLIAALIFLLPADSPSSPLRAWYAINIAIASLWFPLGPLDPLLPLGLCAALRTLKTRNQNAKL